MRGSIRRLLVVAAVTVAAVLGAGHVAVAEPLPGAADGYSYVPKGDRGFAKFDFYGEHLWACDTNSDGLWVRAEVKWAGGTRKVSLPDGNGAASGCGHSNLDISDNRNDVYVRACVEGQGCTQWWWSPV